MKSIKRKAWRNFLNLCEKLDMPQKELADLIAKRGESTVGGYLLRVEGEMKVGDQTITSVSLWKNGNCYYKNQVNPHLFSNSYDNGIFGNIAEHRLTFS